MSEKDKREDNVRYLQENFGWSQEKAENFLDDKVGTRKVQVEARQLPRLLEALQQEGLPYGQVEVRFLVAERDWDSFSRAAEGVAAKWGGFVLPGSNAVDPSAGLPN